jgi:hypothetical protein
MRVEHTPAWEPIPVRYNQAGDTRPGYVCTHVLENGRGQCGGSVFRLEDAAAVHVCFVEDPQ